MIRFLLVFLFFVPTIASAQMAPFIDFSGYFRTFYKDNFRQLEFQPIEKFDASDSHIAYIDTRGDFKVFDGNKTELISNQILSYKLSDGQLAWNIGPTLFALVKGRKQMLTTFARNYIVTDSLVVFEDLRFNTINVLYRGEVIQLMQTTGDLYMPDVIGDNMIAFRDFGDVYRVFWQGETYELGVWNMNPIEFSIGRDMVCFNDPTHRTFAVFEGGEFKDVNDIFVTKYKAGWGFCVFEDINGNLFHYQNGVKTQLSNYSASYWEVKDNCVIWGENSYYYTFYNGEKIQISNFKPSEIQMKNEIIAFRNIMGGVSAFMNGKVHEITNQMDASFQIYSDLVLVGLFNRNFLVYRNGRKFES